MQTIAKVPRPEGQFALLRVRPNPSIEGMPKRLRLLCTPHVKRWASPMTFRATHAV